jgi:predicted nucleic acid-binding protein
VILADTSVWIEHLAHGEPELAARLDVGELLMHPFVIGELACGNLRDRDETLAVLSGLPAAPVASDQEALAFIERRSLMGRGIGYIDVHLLAAVALANSAQLWTRDRRLARAANELGLGFINRSGRNGR